jgi:hypothetical protein
MSIKKSKRSTDGNFSGCIGISVPVEVHKSLYKEASSKNTSIAALVRNILINRSLVNKRYIWTSNEFVKRADYTVMFFTNNIDNLEVCVHLYGEYQDKEDINDSDHKFSNFIVHHLEFKEQKLLSCKFVKDEKGNKHLQLSDWFSV